MTAISPDPNLCAEPIAVRIALIEQARRVLGKKAAAALWEEIGLPLPSSQGRVKNSTLPPQIILDFLTEATAPDTHWKVQASQLFQHFLSWAHQTGRSSMSQTAFGRAMRLTKTGKILSRHAFYTGIRLSPYPIQPP